MDKLTEEISRVASRFDNLPASKEYRSRLKDSDGLIRDDNPYSHFCVYFAAYDPNAKMVFIGHHIKSGLWLFNGGHIDKDESLKEAVSREIKEEWGLNINNIGDPNLITVTNIISNPAKRPCKTHYDIWHFIPVEKESFKPKDKLLKKEFHQTGWHSINSARKLVKDKSTLEALEAFDKIFSQD